MKNCPGCKQTKKKNSFYPRKNRKSGLESRCKECYKIYKIKYRANNKDIIRSQNKKRNPGWNIERYNLLVDQQNNRCAICKTDKPGLSDWSCDHNHTTLQPRGLLCVQCNAGLGYFKDNPEYLQSAIDYLSKWKS